MDKKTEQLKKFFLLSNAMFDFMDSVHVILTQKPSGANEMKELHRKVLHELQKDNVDMVMVDGFMDRMEHVAESYKTPPTSS